MLQKFLHVLDRRPYGGLRPGVPVLDVGREGKFCVVDDVVHRADEPRGDIPPRFVGLLEQV